MVNTLTRYLNSFINWVSFTICSYLSINRKIQNWYNFPISLLESKSISTAILKSLKENSITNEELGMYWKSNTPSWYWYQAPVETQALMIEVFGEIENVPVYAWNTFIPQGSFNIAAPPDFSNSMCRLL